MRTGEITAFGVALGCWEAEMKRRLRCRLQLHRWVTKQDSGDAPRYQGCLYCDKTRDPERWPSIFYL